LFLLFMLEMTIKLFFMEMLFVLVFGNDNKIFNFLAVTKFLWCYTVSIQTSVNSSAAWPRGLKRRFYGDRVITIT